MSTFVNINGPVVADTAYVNNALAARDVAISLPEVTPVTADLQALGTMSLPIWQMIENMELAVTKIGVDMGFRSMIRPEPTALEFRWAQTITDANAATKTAGCKAFIRGIPSKIPGVSVTPGEAIEAECTFMVTRYQLIVDGVEMFLIDRLAGIVRIGGTDYAAALKSLL